MSQPLVPLITKDPVTGDELVVTRLWGPTSGIVIEGRFALGWIARLTTDQLEFVGLLLRTRNNLQKLANDLGVAYNTARSRLDEVVEALGGSVDTAPAGRPDRGEVLAALAGGDLDVPEAIKRLKGGSADG